MIKNKCLKLQNVCFNLPSETFLTPGALLKEPCQAQGTKNNSKWLLLFLKIWNILYVLNKLIHKPCIKVHCL